MNEKLATALTDVTNTSDLPFSSDIQKKIKRNYFKETPVKSYKCSFISPEINTAAKLYVSTDSLHIVHRPKRRRLTTILFNQIHNVRPPEDGQSIEIRLTNGVSLTLTNFERPDSAISFIVNFWNMVRKEKIISRYAGSFSVSRTGNNSERSSALSVEARLPSESSLSKMPTTISLNSSASVSETDSLDGRQVTKFTISPSVRSPPTTLISPVDRNPEPHRMASIPDYESCGTTEVAVVPTRIDPVGRTPVSNTSSIEHSLSDPSDKPHCQSSAVPRVNSDCIVAQRPAPMLRGEPASSPTVDRSLSNRVRPCRTGKVNTVLPGVRSKAVVCLTESQGWSLWPLSFLPYPFSNPPQRMTMIIAYVILAFLLFSTMHLYHRLAVFDLHGGSSLGLDHKGRSSTTRPTEFADSMETLKTQLGQLVSLADELTQSMKELTEQVRFRQPDHTSSQSTTTAHSPLGT